MSQTLSDPRAPTLPDGSAATARRSVENALIKLSVVVSDLFGASGRAIMAALIAGERDPAVLAELTRGRLRANTDRLTEVLTGRFTEQRVLADPDAATDRRRRRRHRHRAGPD